MSRFSIRGFTQTGTDDTDYFDVEIGTIKLGGTTVVVHLIRDTRYAWTKFTLKKVFYETERNPIWSFSQTSPYITFLAEAGNEIVIAFVERGKGGELEKVAPLSNLLKHKQISLEQHLELKKLAATYLGIGWRPTHAEERMESRRREKEQQAEREREAQLRKEKENRRRELVDRLCRRKSVEAFTSFGRLRFGVPVVGNEWHVLKNDVNVVRVESYDDETGRCGKAVEAFKVQKIGNKEPCKYRPLPVSFDEPDLEPKIPEPIKTMFAELRDGTYEVLLYRTVEDIRLARASGLNSGTHAAANDLISKGKHTVFEVKSTSMDSVGNHELFA